jgi:multisubunit Na+/H+ antiporter MnhB subunit
MGEITVLAIATVGVLMLINLVPKERSVLKPVSKHGMLPVSTNNVILYASLKNLALIIIVSSLFIFWAGHNAPGGGFIAGLMLSGAIILIYLVRGKMFSGPINLNYKLLLPLGLTFAVGCGLGGVFFGNAFLAHTFGHFHIPFFGEIELATATIFDFGVFLVVVGTVMSIVTNIGKGQEDL